MWSDRGKRRKYNEEEDRKQKKESVTECQLKDIIDNSVWEIQDELEEWLTPLPRNTTLQRHNTENSIQILPEKELRGLNPSFHVHVSERNFYIPIIGLSILLQENIWTDPGKKINHSQTHECGNWDWGRAIPFLEIHKGDFRCSAQKYIAQMLYLSTYKAVTMAR